MFSFLINNNCQRVLRVLHPDRGINTLSCVHASHLCSKYGSYTPWRICPTVTPTRLLFIGRWHDSGGFLYKGKSKSCERLHDLYDVYAHTTIFHKNVEIFLSRCSLPGKNVTIQLQACYDAAPRQGLPQKALRGPLRTEKGIRISNIFEAVIGPLPDVFTN